MQLRILVVMTALLVGACSSEPEGTDSANVADTSVTPGLRISQDDGGSNSYTYFRHGDGALLRNIASYADLEAFALTCSGDTCTTVDADVNPGKACYLGDRNQICALLAEMSREDREEYADGDHERVTLSRCFLQGAGVRPVIARLEAIHDFAPRSIKAEIQVTACED